MIKHTFSKQKDQEFSKTLKERVNAYFKDLKIPKTANRKMVIKSVVVISLYLGVFTTILVWQQAPLYAVFGLWVMLGLGAALIGCTVMHDSLHGSYTRNKVVGRLLSFSAYMVGANPRIWQVQHNMCHHTYTNIEHADNDIGANTMLRLTPHQKRRWFHKAQHIYALALYSLMTMAWITTKDFKDLTRYTEAGFIKEGREHNRLLATIIIQKLAYFAVYLGVPILLLPHPAWMVALMFLVAHMVSGMSLAIIFQSAHVVEGTQFIEQEEQLIDENWLVHQLKTTANFAPKNKVIGWLFGGLNFQIEHHLFPTICHTHYPGISTIVRQTAKEFGMPYHSYKSFIGAARSHLKLLKQLGNQDGLAPLAHPIPIKASSGVMK